MSQASLNRHFHQVVDALNSYEANYISFPNDKDLQDEISRGFYSLAGFPNVVGVIDGTQIPIQRPYDFAEQYVNRKGFHSINTQVLICFYKIL